MHCCVVCSVRYAYVLNNEYYYRYLWILNKFSKKNENTMFYIHMIWYIFLFEEIGTPVSADTESKHLKKKVTESRKKWTKNVFWTWKTKWKWNLGDKKKTQCQNRHKTNDKKKTTLITHQNNRCVRLCERNKHENKQKHLKYFLEWRKIDTTKRLLNLFSQNRDKEQKRIYFRNLLNWRKKN